MVKVRLRRAFQVSSTNRAQVLEAAFQSQSCCWPAIGSYMTPPSVAGASCARAKKMLKLNTGGDQGPWDGFTSSPKQPPYPPFNTWGPPNLFIKTPPPKVCLI